MRPRFLSLACSILFLSLISTVTAVPARCSDTPSGSRASNESVEGTVVSSTPNTLVVRTDDNQFQLFTYDGADARTRPIAQGARVRVIAGAADENGTRPANDVAVLAASSSITAESRGAGQSRDKGFQAAPVPNQVRDVENDIRRESQRWRLGVRAGAALNPELFSFGVQSQMGPIFNPRVLFRPNTEFAFGEVTDLVALNLEGIYRFSNAERRGIWTPYVGAGPAMIFIHQNFQAGRQIDFGNFDYETGLNILAGMQSRRGTFLELKTSLYSGPAPKLRLIVGYNF
jgi:hypothetical protein